MPIKSRGQQMSTTIENAKFTTMPYIALRGLVAFPAMPLSLELTESADIRAAKAANDSDGFVFFITQRDPSLEAPRSKRDFFHVGTVAKVRQFITLNDNSVRILADGICRATVAGIFTDTYLADVVCKTIVTDRCDSLRTRALMREAIKMFDEFLKYLPKFAKDLQVQIKSIETPGALADAIANAVLVNPDDKQTILDAYDGNRRLESLVAIMDKELELLGEELNIHQEVRRRLEENQKEFYLREQLKVIREELGMTSEEDDDEIEEYLSAIKKAHLPKEVEEKLTKEVGKLAKTPYGSAECAVLRSYLDTCLEIPWNKSTKDKTDVAAARAVLDRDHTGLDKVKERVLEFIAVKQLNPDIKNQIICLVGPPGTGKTSIASSLAKALGRKYVRGSLGGVRDEADIRGHRKTYVAAMPGRIVTGLTQAGVNNPLMLLDEIDKLTHDAHGDPASALLEVLDSEQNKTFRDHFVEIPVDLSDVLFICSANTLETVPKPLIDRMEIIELQSYSRAEKLAIARDHLLPKQMKRHGLTKRQFTLTEDGICAVIDDYTRESGVRNLEREISSLCRKAAKEMIETGAKKIKIDALNVASYLGPRKLIPEKVYERDEVGIVNGLAWTQDGGALLRVEAVATEGTGKLELTGSLGDVMKESARIAVTYIRAHAKELGIDPEFYKKYDIHIHFPEGATPKDGPSAGAALVCALTSELGSYPARRDVAMTGEVTLHGKVLAIGGLREKTMAAAKAGMRKVLIPEENRCDEKELDPSVLSVLELSYFSDVKEYLDAVLIMDKDTVSKDKPIIENDGCAPYYNIPTKQIRGNVRNEAESK